MKRVLKEKALTKPEVDEFLLAQYKALRDEILGLMERVVRIQLIGVTAIPLVIGAGEKYELGLVTAAGPVVTVVFALILLYEQNGLMRAGEYIRSHLEPYLCPSGVLGWEAWLEIEPKNRNAERYLAWSAYIAFTLYYAGGTYLAYRSIRLEYGLIAASMLAVVYSIIFVVAFCFVVVNFRSSSRRIEEEHNGNYIRGEESPKS